MDPLLESPQEKARRVAQNTVAQVVAMAATAVSKLLVTIVIGRLYGAAEVGKYATVMTLSLIFTFLASAGLNWSLIRESATRPERIHQFVGNGWSIVLLAGLVTVPMMVATAVALGYATMLVWAVAFAAIALVIDSLAQVVGAAFNGVERMTYHAAILIGQELAFLVLSGVVLMGRLPFLWLFILFIPSRLVGLVLAVPLYRRVFGRWPALAFDPPFMRGLLRTSLPYMANMALGPIYLRIDVLMLSYYQTPAAVGLYEAASSIFYRLNVLARMVNNALMPLMAREYETAVARVRHYLQVALKYQIVIGLPLTVWGLLLAQRLMTLVYGPGFGGAGVVFGIIATIITLRFVDNTLATTLTAVNQQASRSWVVAAAALFNIGANVIAIPRYSYPGAAVTTVLTELLFCIGLYGMVARRVTQPVAWGLLARPLMAAAAMAGVVGLLRQRPLWLPLLAGGAVYLLGLVLLNVITVEERRFLRQLVRLPKRPSSLNLTPLPQGEQDHV